MNIIVGIEALNNSKTARRMRRQSGGRKVLAMSASSKRWREGSRIGGLPKRVSPGCIATSLGGFDLMPSSEPLGRKAPGGTTASLPMKTWSPVRTGLAVIQPRRTSSSPSTTSSATKQRSPISIMS